MDDSLDRARLADLPAALNAKNQQIAIEASPICPGEPERGPWRLCLESDCPTPDEQIGRYGFLWVDGPWDLTITVGTRLCYVHHWHRWWRLFDSPKVAIGLRRICRILSKAIGGTRAIYLPDNMLPSSGALYFASERGRIDDEESRPIGVVEAWLAGKFGPPPDILPGGEGHEMLTKNEDYFIERFE
jgi:hypothetical protein